MIKLLPLLLIPLLANIWVHWIFGPVKIYLIKKIKWLPARLKPLDCESCLSFWITAAWYIRCDYFMQGIILSGIAYMIGSIYSGLFTTYLNKYYARIRYKKRFGR